MQTLPAPAKTAAREYLSFALGREDYAIDILQVREIRGHVDITRLADMPAALLGVTRLRGDMIPVVDLRRTLGLPPGGLGLHNVVIMVSLERQLVGLVVDDVSDVLSLSSEQIRPATALGLPNIEHYLHGLASLDGGMLRLLDVKRLLDRQELLPGPGGRPLSCH